MKTKEVKKGISLIVLIITIIIVIILAAVVILTLSKNNPIESAKEARFKEDVRTFQDELALYISKHYANAGGHRDDKITTSEYDEIKEYIPSFSEKYRDKFIIQDDELKYTKKLDDKEKEYVQNLNVNKRKSILPDEYQQVEYIESTGKQYIDTGLSHEKYLDICCEIKGNYTKIVSNKFIFGTGIDASYTLIGINYQSVNFGAQNGKDGTEQVFCKADLSEHIFKLDLMNGKAYLDDDFQIQLTNDSSKINYYNYMLFTANIKGGSTNQASSFIMKYCKIMRNNILIRDYIPCYSTTTVTDINGKQCLSGTVGLYDLVEGKFYTNQGTGEFIAGPEVDE